MIRPLNETNKQHHLISENAGPFFAHFLAHEKSSFFVMFFRRNYSPIQGTYFIPGGI